MKTLNEIKSELKANPKTWLVTGCAGFIGSHLLFHLLDSEQRVVGLDNLSSGSKDNLSRVQDGLKGSGWSNFEFFKEDIRILDPSSSLMSGVDFVLHQAAIASVPLSIENPLETFENNVFGTEIVLEMARRASVKKVVLASSSAVYGDDPAEAKDENTIGNPLSPYANSKFINERQCLQLSKVFSIPTVALRYFNAYGEGQSPDGPYAAVIPSWQEVILQGKAPKVFGDGSQTRDFLHVNDVVKANFQSALHQQQAKQSFVFNVGGGNSVSLNELFQIMKEAAGAPVDMNPEYLPEREGDIKHSRSSIHKIKSILGFEPEVELPTGLKSLFG